MEMLSWKNPSSGIALHTSLPLTGVSQEATFGHWLLDLSPANKRTLLSEGGPSYDWSLVVKIAPQPASRQFRPIRGDFRFHPLMTSQQEC